MNRTILSVSIALVLLSTATVGAFGTKTETTIDKPDVVQKAELANDIVLLNSLCPLGPGVTVLSANTPVSSSLPATAGASCEFSFTPTAGAGDTQFRLTGLASDFDLYVKRGSLPTTSSWECRPYSGGTTAETCTVANDGQVVYAMVLRYSGSGAFTITAGAVAPACSLGAGTISLASGVSVSGSLSNVANAACRFSLAPGAGDVLKFDATNLADDFDLYVKLGSAPSTTSFDCRSWNFDTDDETCTVANDGRTAYVMIIRYTGSGGFTLTGTDVIVPELLNGVPVAGTSTPGSNTLYKLIVPAGATAASFALGGDPSAQTCGIVTCAPDADLYVRRNAIPSTSLYSCRSWAYGNTESCTFQTDAYANLGGDPVGGGGPGVIRPFAGAGKYYVLVNGYAGTGDWVLQGATA